MNKKAFLFLIVSVLILLNGVAYAQTSQPNSLVLKLGFNFVSFTAKPSITPADFKNVYYSSTVEEVYTYSAVSGSFLSVGEGTLTAFNLGRGYIIKAKAAQNIYLDGVSAATIGDIKLKAGFNLLGFSKVPESVKFSDLMKKYSVIKGLYKWSAASGSFIQVIRNDSNDPELLDGVDPTITIGQAYFINVTADTSLNYDGDTIKFEGGSIVTPGVKTLTGLTISKTADTVSPGGSYDLNSLTVTALYSDSTSKPVALQWVISSGNGTIENQIYKASGIEGATSSLTGTYTEASTIKTVSIILTIKKPDTISKIVEKLTLKTNNDSILIGGTYDFSKVKATVQYTDGTTKEVVITEWECSGNLQGEMHNNIYYSSAQDYYYNSNAGSEGHYTAKYIEPDRLSWGWSDNYFTLKVLKDETLPLDVLTFASISRSLVDSNGSTIAAYNASNNSSYLDVPTGTIEKTEEIIFAQVYDKGINDLLYSAGHNNAYFNNNFYIKSSGYSSNSLVTKDLMLYIPMPESSNLEESILAIAAIDPITKAKISDLPYKIVTPGSLSPSNSVNRFDVIKDGQKVIVVGLATYLLAKGAIEILVCGQKPIIPYKNYQPDISDTIIGIPYYQQYFQLCLPACIAMVSANNGYKSTINEIAAEIITNIPKNNEDYSTFKPEYRTADLSLYGMIEEDLKGLTSFTGLLNKIITSVNNGNPVILFYDYNDDQHAIVVVGYKDLKINDKGEGNYDNLKLIIHNPVPYGFQVQHNIPNGPYAELNKNGLGNICIIINNLGLIRGIKNIRFFSVARKEIENQITQTIQIPDYDFFHYPDKPSGIIFKKKGVTDPVDYVWGDHTIKPKGYKFIKAGIDDKGNDNPIDDFDIINLNEVPICNSIYSNPDLNPKLSIKIVTESNEEIYADNTITLTKLPNQYYYNFTSYDIPWHEFKASTLVTNSKFNRIKRSTDISFKLIVDVTIGLFYTKPVDSFVLPFKTKN